MAHPHRPRPKPKPRPAPQMVQTRRLPPAHLLGSGLIPGTYDQQAAGLQHDYTSALADLDTQQGSLFHDTGFKGTIGPDGQVQYGVDPTQQFGAYQNLLRGLADNLATSRQDAVSLRPRRGRASSRSRQPGSFRFLWRSGRPTPQLHGPGGGHLSLARRGTLHS